MKTNFIASFIFILTYVLVGCCNDVPQYRNYSSVEINNKTLKNEIKKFINEIKKEYPKVILLRVAKQTYGIRYNLSYIQYNSSLHQDLPDKYAIIDDNVILIYDANNELFGIKDNYINEIQKLLTDKLIKDVELNEVFYNNAENISKQEKNTYTIEFNIYPNDSVEHIIEIDDYRFRSSFIKVEFK